MCTKNLKFLLMSLFLLHLTFFIPFYDEIFASNGYFKRHDFQKKNNMFLENGRCSSFVLDANERTNEPSIALRIQSIRNAKVLEIEFGSR